MRVILAALIAVAFISTPAIAQTRLFSEESEIQLAIEAPLTTLIREAPRDTTAYPAVVTVLGDGEPQRFNILLSARGVSRRTRGRCAFPPFRLDFARDEVRGTLLHGQNRLKLVTRCRPGGNYEQVNALEYLAYRLYNEVTPLSYRARLVRVTYRDTEGRRREEIQENFLIEDIDDVARRNRSVALEVAPDAVSSSQLDPQAAARYALFQFMIGNLDWDMVSGRADDECCHNSKLIAASATVRSAITPTPYDFDSSGLVNAPYAGPPASLPVRNVRQRYYRGLCRHNDQVPDAIATFQQRRSTFRRVIEEAPRVNESRRAQALRYIDDFFELIEDPERVQSQIIERCRR